MQAWRQLGAIEGQWHGRNRLHDPHSGRPDDSPATLTVMPVLGGRFLRMAYDWTYRGQSQEGELLLGRDPKTNEATGHWIDSWHMGNAVMACRGAFSDSHRAAITGAYAAPPGPDWGWRIEFDLAGDVLRLAMFNIDPGGESAPAVEAEFHRKEPPAERVAAAGKLSRIRQIAVTVSDVDRMLAFYRDVLGLEFLFRPGPNLAFLAAGDLRLMLATPEGAGQAAGASVIYFQVEGVADAHQAIVARGAASERAPHLIAKMPDHELWIGFVRDPDGNLVGLLEEVRAG